MTTQVILRTKTRETGMGFCNACGIIRDDIDGIPWTDCVCTAKIRHAEGCMYIKAVSMWVSVGWCEAHGLDACPACDCTCGATGPYRQYLEAKTRQEFLALLAQRRP
jgi:hypothetical protein